MLCQGQTWRPAVNLRQDPQICRTTHIPRPHGRNSRPYGITASANYMEGLCFAHKTIIGAKAPAVHCASQMRKHLSTLPQHLCLTANAHGISHSYTPPLQDLHSCSVHPVERLGGQMLCSQRISHTCQPHKHKVTAIMWTLSQQALYSSLHSLLACNRLHQ